MSNRRNLYVRNEDLEVWEKAERLDGDLSPLVSRLLRRYVEQREAATGRIVVTVGYEDGSVVRKAFRGRMLVVGFYSEDPIVRAGTTYHAAQGVNGGLALWTGHDPDPRDASDFLTYASFEQAKAEDFGQPASGIGWPQDFLSAVSSALGEDYAEEIDL